MSDLIDQNLSFTSLSQDLDSGALTLRELSGKEGLSELYRYELVLEGQGDVELDDATLESVLNHEATISFGAGGGTTVHGLLPEISVDALGDGRTPIYRAVLVPRLWALTQTVRSRIFRELSLPDIAKQILTEHGFVEDTDFTFDLKETYASREYVVQYEEDDLRFVARLMEHLGIFFFFEQGEVEKVLFSDSNDSFTTLTDWESVPFHGSGGRAAAEQQGVHAITRRLRARPAKVLLKDYNWRTPAVELDTELDVDEATGRGTHIYYGEHYKDPEEGAWLAEIRKERLLCERSTFEGSCTLTGLFPGHYFELTDHPLGSFDQQYLVTSIEHRAVAGAGTDGAASEYDKRFTAQPYEVAFRPARATPKPRVYGFMHAHVEGIETGAAAPLDENGSYLITLPIDSGRADRAEEEGSRRIRMAQASSGAGYGVHIPLHVGAEVAIAHLDGDPDRPIIIGSPPNAETVSPVVNENAQQSEIRTQKGTFITFDDQATS